MLTIYLSFQVNFSHWDDAEQPDTQHNTLNAGIWYRDKAWLASHIWAKAASNHGLKPRKHGKRMKRDEKGWKKHDAPGITWNRTLESVPKPENFSPSVPRHSGDRHQTMSVGETKSLPSKQNWEYCRHYVDTLDSVDEQFPNAFRCL